MCSGSRARITSSVKTLLPNSWRIGTVDLGARRPWLGHEVTASMAASLARVYVKIMTPMFRRCVIRPVSAWALSFLIQLGDHGLWVRLHIILATLATKVESSSLRGDLERCTHIAEVLAADGADRLLEREVLFGRRQSLDPGDLGVGELDRRAIVMGGVRLGAFQRGRIGLLGIILRRGRDGLCALSRSSGRACGLLATGCIDLVDGRLGRAAGTSSSGGGRAGVFTGTAANSEHQRQHPQATTLFHQSTSQEIMRSQSSTTPAVDRMTYSNGPLRSPPSRSRRVWPGVTSPTNGLPHRSRRPGVCFTRSRRVHGRGPGLPESLCRSGGYLASRPGR